MTRGGGRVRPSSFTPDGQEIAVVDHPQGDISLSSVENGQAAVRPLLQTPEKEQRAELSPDGRWLAYASDESGRTEVYMPPRVGIPRMLFTFDRDVSFSTLPRGYDVSSDGQRSCGARVLPFQAPAPVTRINLAQNWFEELKAKVPAATPDGQTIVFSRIQDDRRRPNHPGFRVVCRRQAAGVLPIEDDLGHRAVSRPRARALTACRRGESVPPVRLTPLGYQPDRPGVGPVGELPA